MPNWEQEGNPHSTYESAVTAARWYEKDNPNYRAHIVARGRGWAVMLAKVRFN